MIAFESMNRNDQAKVRRAVELLKNDDLKPLKLNRIKNARLDVWVARINNNIRLLFNKSESEILVVDIVDHRKEIKHD
jgi:Txe/YoeB family toxin of Txe-Axe toxin-antitoxin module